MGSLQMTRIDLECAGGSNFSIISDDDERSTCTLEADEGSCHTQYYSTSGGSIDGHNFDFEIDNVFDTRRVSSVVESDCSVDIENEFHELKLFLETMERSCRICHVSFEVDGSDAESGIAIVLGCSCKNDLAAAHQHCAETWFRIKGDIICEICNSIARNVIVPIDIVSTQQIPQVSTSSTNANSEPVPTNYANSVPVPTNYADSAPVPTNANYLPVPSTSETLTFLTVHRFVNILLPCVVSIFFLSWLFHFYMHF